MKIVVTGGTGLIGTYLQKELLNLGYEVVILTRKERVSTIKNLSYVTWNISKGEIDKQAICSADAIVHLAGASIAESRWTNKQKQKIIASRVETANLIFKTLKENQHAVKTMISASGADCYGLKMTSKIYKESDVFGTDFLADVCKQWENAATQFHQLGIRTVCVRTGLVFAKNNSALQKMAKPIYLGIGAPLGSGKQIVSIIHLHDLCKLYIYAIQNKEIKGTYNAVATNRTNEELTEQIAKQLKKRLFMPNIPSWFMKVLFGEMASILIEGNAVDNQKIKDTGFQFEYPSIEEILKDTL